MGVPLKVLVVEDSENDALLVLNELKRSGFDPHSKRVETADMLQSALREKPWDVVISDYSLPGFTGMAALRMIRDGGSDLPVILVSGAIGEALAVDAMKAGANDYVMKDNLVRLGPAVQRELREAEGRRQRRALEQRLRFTQFSVDHAAECILWIRPDASFASVNDAVCAALGYTRDELLQMKVGDIDVRFREDAWAAHWLNLRELGTLTFESMHLTRDGRSIPVEINANYLVMDGEEFNVAFVRDISERKEMEGKLREAERLQLIGHLVLGVAHEVRNPLNCIMAVAEALQEELGESPSYKLYVRHIREQVDRLAELVRDLLDMGKPLDPERMHRDSLPNVLSSALALWKEGWRGGPVAVTFEQPDPAEGLDVVADSARLQQVFINLLDNAAQHAPEGSEIGVEVGAGSDGMLSVRISDEGGGMPNDVLQRIPEPFFTTRKGGTGLGLCIVQRVIRDHGGDVVFRNNSPRPGCTVEVRLPQAS